MRSLLNTLFVRSVKIVTSIHGIMISHRRTRQLAAHLAELIPPNKCILDIGSGNGKLAKKLRDLRPDLSIYGIDVKCDPKSAIPVAQYDGKKIPFDDDSWQICMANDVLHHCDDPLALLREMNRVTKEAIILKDHVADSNFNHKLLSAMDWIGNFGYGTRVPFNFLSSTEWERAYNELGLMQLQIRSSLRLYPYPFTWIFDGNLHFITVLKVKKSLTS